MKPRPRRKAANSLELSQLCNHRYWLKEKEGPNMVNGWVTFASDEKLALEVHGRCRFTEGDEALCSVAHPTCTAQFIVEIVSVLPTSLVVRPHGVMHVPQKGEDPRRKVSRDIQISVSGEDVGGKVIDVSLGGIGLEVPCEIAPETTIECELAREGYATIELRGKVAYCRPITDSRGYRIGVMLARLDRLDNARWKLYVREGDTVVVRRRLTA